jgi:mRNA interferase HigB
MFNIITRKTLLDYCDAYPQARTAILEWYHECYNKDFKNFNELNKLIQKEKAKNTRLMFIYNGFKKKL